jgi:hypothetical protein
MKRAFVRHSGVSCIAAVTLAAVVLAGGSDSPKELFAQGGPRISGAGISKVARDTRKLTVTAQANAGSSTATGTVLFIHNCPAGLSRFRGTVTCLSVTGGTAQVSGVIEKGETATGALLDGKTYAFTIHASASPQTFSLPTVGEASAVGPCSGGSSQAVAVTEDGFKLQ